jgi:hypothetical protein
MSEQDKYAGATPGPWAVHSAHDASGYPCFYIHGMAGEQKWDAAALQATCKLIAATPALAAENTSLRATRDELLEALRECVVALAHAQDSLAIRINPPTLENARAAIKNATEGKQ